MCYNTIRATIRLCSHKIAAMDVTQSSVYGFIGQNLKKETIHMKKQYTAAVLAILLLLSTTACTKDEPPVEKIEAPTVLTNVYKGKIIEMPQAEDYSIREYLGIDGDNLLFWGNYFHAEENPETGEFTYENYPVTCTVPITGGEPVIEKLDMSIENLRSLSLFDGGIMALQSIWDENTMAETYNMSLRYDDGTTETVENLGRFFSTGNEYFYLQQACIDKEGYIYLIGDGETVVLNPDLTKAFSVTQDNWVESVDQDPNGTVYISYGHYDEAAGQYKQVFAPIDKTTQKLGESVTLPEGIQANSFFFGEGFDVYYYNDTGIYGYNMGDTDGTLLMHFQNSDITGDLDLVKALDGDTFLLEYYDRISWDRQMGIFTKAPDIDLSQIQVLEIATAETSYDLPTMVVNYNRSHTDSRVVVTDYSQYNTAEDPDGGQTKLANDILNGILEPDMICGYYSSSAYQAILENDLYADLNTYLTTDTVLPRENLFGCVLNTYQDDGKIFGLPMAISIETLIANKNLVGDIDRWTVEEMLNCLTGLPDGVVFMSELTQLSAAHLLLGENGYGNFVNLTEGTCSFDSPTFIQFLEYMATLPAELQDDYYENRNEDRYGPYKTGKVAAATMYYHGINSFLEERVYFGAENTVHPGFPVSDGYSGVRLGSYETLFTILHTADAPETCWTFIRDALIQVNTPDQMRGSSNIPMLRSSLDSLQEEYKDTTFVVHYDGGMSWGSGFNPTEEDLKNGEAFTLTDADWKDIENFLDTIGGPLGSSTLPNDLSVIINEEVSAFMSGTRSAADCAAMLQNRVSLYLAEQG